MQAFPLFLSTTGRSVLVFGAGAEAAAKLRLLVKTEASIWLIAPSIDSAEIALDALPQVKHLAADPLTAPLPSDALFAYAAIGERALDAAIAQRMRGLGILVCAADQPEVSDFITPAIVDRDPVVVAIGTEGSAPMLARRLKAQIEAIMPSPLGQVANLARSLRPWVAKTLAPGRERREFWQAFFAAPAPHTGQEARALAHQLAQNGKPSARLSLIGTGSADPELLPLKARRALDEADLVLFEPGLPLSLLELARREAERLPINALSRPLDQELAQRLAGGRAVALVARSSDPRSLLPRGLALPPATDLIPGIAPLEPIQAPQRRRAHLA